MKNQAEKMERREIIGCAMVAIGMMVTVGIVDGSSHELLLRLGGIAIVVAGGFVGRLFRNDD